MPEIPPNKHGVLQIMMLRLDAVYSPRMNAWIVSGFGNEWGFEKEKNPNMVHFGQGAFF